MARSVVAIGGLVLGICFLAGAGYVWAEYDLAHYGQGTYTITGMAGSEVTPSATVPENASVVAYTDLPPKAQRAFDKARRGKRHILWAQDDRQAVQALLPYSTEYIEYRGRFYRILLLSGHRGPDYWRTAVLKFGVTAGIGVVLLGVGVRELWLFRSTD